MANCWRRRLTLRETTPGTMSQALPSFPGRRVADLPFWVYASTPCAQSLRGPELVPILRNGGDEPGTGAGDHVAAVVEDELVAVVRVGHVGGGPRGWVERAEQGEPVRIGAEAAEGLAVA